MAAELWGTAWLGEDKVITADEQIWLDQQSQRLAAGEPLAYIL